MKIGMYTGSFDPITNGHLDIIKRGAAMFDVLYVVIAINPQKKTMFTKDERKQMVLDSVKEISNVKVETCESLIVDFAKKNGIQFILRGLRAVTDFESELQMADTNRILSPDVETVFIVASKEYYFLSSSAVKEIAQFGGSIHHFVPKNVEEKIKEKNIKKA